MARRPSCIPYLQLAVLLLLEGEGGLCGYRIYLRLVEAGLHVEDAVVYRVLEKLRARGLIEVVEHGPRGRVRYRITPRGREELGRLLEAKRSLDRALEALGGR